jgi:hypothetical protein
MPRELTGEKNSSAYLRSPVSQSRSSDYLLGY